MVGCRSQRIFPLLVKNARNGAHGADSFSSVRNKVKGSGQECPLHTCKVLLCVLDLLAGFVVDGEFFGYWFQNGIELDEGVLNGGVVLVAHCQQGFLGGIASEVLLVSPKLKYPHLSGKREESFTSTAMPIQSV
jgi:hypothetical protein